VVGGIYYSISRRQESLGEKRISFHLPMNIQSPRRAVFSFEFEYRLILSFERDKKDNYFRIAVKVRVLSSRSLV
jgi:hypothetical protein